ncbi:MAG: hypothetical protein FWG74_02265 [Planctomycetes bacterium]|nr:hypothetical protein [Planctomycetota bacterium]
MSSVSEVAYGPTTSTVYQREQAEKADNNGKVTSQNFLKLLVTQLQNQDPLNPQSDLDFTAQLAQLQALDEQMAMTKAMQSLRKDTLLQAGTGMIGKYVTGLDDSGSTATGLVSRLVQAEGNVYIELANKQRIEVSSVLNVWDNATNMYNDLATSGGFIGMWVEAGYDSAWQPIRGIVESVHMMNGEVYLKLYGGQYVLPGQVTELRVPTDDELFYILPDSVRQKVELAQRMADMGITGTDTNGNLVDGIVASAELDPNTHKVYLILYNGTKVDIDNLQGDPRKPTAQDAANSLRGLWASGLNEQGQEIGGIVVDAKDYDNGMALVLDTGEEVYFDALFEIRNPTEEEKNRLD